MTINLYVYSPFVFLISCLGCKKYINDLIKKKENDGYDEV